MRVSWSAERSSVSFLFRAEGGEGWAVRTLLVHAGFYGVFVVGFGWVLEGTAKAGCHVGVLVCGCCSEAVGDGKESMAS